MQWSKKANPVAHEAHIYRELLDIKMLQKKKKSREMSNMLSNIKSTKATPLSGSASREGMADQAGNRNT